MFLGRTMGEIEDARALGPPSADASLRTAVWAATYVQVLAAGVHDGPRDVAEVLAAPTAERHFLAIAAADVAVRILTHALGAHTPREHAEAVERVLATGRIEP